MNTLAADDNYSPRNVQNFQQQLPTAIISNTKDFAGNFYFFSQIYIKFRTFFLKKDECPRLRISSIIDSERGGYLNL